MIQEIENRKSESSIGAWFNNVLGKVQKALAPFPDHPELVEAKVIAKEVIALNRAMEPICNPSRGVVVKEGRGSFQIVEMTDKEKLVARMAVQAEIDRRILALKTKRASFTSIIARDFAGSLIDYMQDRKGRDYRNVTPWNGESPDEDLLKFMDQLGYDYMFEDSVTDVIWAAIEQKDITSALRYL